MRLSLLALAAFLLIGAAYFLRPQANNWLFDEDAFANCFRTEAVAAYQIEGSTSGNDLLVISADTLLGPSLESLAHSIAASVGRNGIDAELQDAKARVAERTRKSWEVYESTGAFPEKAAEDIIHETTVNCLERQLRF